MSVFEGIYSRIARAGGVHTRVCVPVYTRNISRVYVCARGSLSLVGRYISILLNIFIYLFLLGIPFMYVLIRPVTLYPLFTPLTLFFTQ